MKQINLNNAEHMFYLIGYEINIILNNVLNFLNATMRFSREVVQWHGFQTLEESIMYIKLGGTFITDETFDLEKDK